MRRFEETAPLRGDLYGRLIPAAQLHGGAARPVDLMGTGRRAGPAEASGTGRRRAVVASGH
jgi:hypothetical protein